MAMRPGKIRWNLMPILAILAGSSLVLGLGYGSAELLGDLDWLIQLLGMLAAATLTAGLIFAWLDTSIRAVTRQTLAQCFRMKLAVVFLVLLIIVLAALPFLVRGDETLAGRIRTFMVYSMMAVTWLLSLLTVLSSLLLISGDVETRTAWMLLSKPLGRAEYILGRFMGVLTMNAILLLVSGGIIFVVLQTMRSAPAVDHADRQVVETEIFTARAEVPPVEPDYEKLVDAKIAELKKLGTYESILNDFHEYGQRLGDTPEERLRAQLTTDVRRYFEIAPANGRLGWEFRGLSISGQLHTEPAEIQRLETFTPQGQEKTWLRVKLKASESLTGRLRNSGPVKINDVRGRVSGLTLDAIDVVFTPAETSLPAVRELKETMTVQVAAEPVLQFRCKARAILPEGAASVESLFRVLEVQTGEGQPVFVIPGEIPADTLSTTAIPAIQELRTGTLRVIYLNVPPRGKVLPPVGLPFKHISLLYEVDNFEMNFFRALLLILARLAFLAALGAFLGSFLSFPVGAMSALVLLVAGALVDWLISEGTPPQLSGDAMTVISGLTGHALQMLLPSLASISPGEKLVDGLLLPWRQVSDATVLAVATRGIFYLSLGCMIFRQRELAKVQV